MDAKLLQKFLAEAQRSKKQLEEKMNEIQNSVFTSKVGDLFSITMNGRYEVVDCEISDKALADKETLKDLIVSSTGDVLQQIQQRLKEIESKFLPKGVF